MRKLTDDASWEAWCADFDDVKSEMHTLFHTRWMWRTLTKLMESADPQFVVVQNYFVRTYVATVTTAIRREADRDTRSTSLARCLQALIDCPHFASRARYVATVHESQPNDAQASRLAGDGFDRFAPNGGAFIDPAIVHADLERLDDAAAPVKKYTNKVIAHRDRNGRAQKIKVSFDDINHALEEIGELTKKYFRLRQPGTELAALTPTVEHSFLSMFDVPWYREGFEAPDEWDGG